MGLLTRGVGGQSQWHRSVRLEGLVARTAKTHSVMRGHGASTRASACTFILLSQLFLPSGVASGAPTVTNRESRPAIDVHTMLDHRNGSIARQVRSAPGPAGVLAVGRRTKVVFSVPRTTIFDCMAFHYPKQAGRYVAFYVPGRRHGCAWLRDPGSVLDWPVQVEFGVNPRWVNFRPGRRYTLLIAVDRPASIPLPFPMQVKSLHATTFEARAQIQQIRQVAPASAATVGRTPDTTTGMPLSATAIAIDWAHDPLRPQSLAQANACPTDSSLGGTQCSGDWNIRFVNDTSTCGVANGCLNVDGPHQYVIGEAFDQPVDAGEIAGFAINAPVPFTSATLYGFGIAPPASSS